MNRVLHGEVMDGAGNAIVLANDSASAPLSTSAPIVPRVDVRVREGTPADLPFIDRMQKAHSRELGFLPTAALEGKIERGEVLVAEGIEPQSHGGSEANLVSESDTTNSIESQKDDLEGQCGTSLSASVSQCRRGESVGYLIAADRYQKRDEIGCITQINVVPELRRSLVAGMLLQAQFDRSAYGCRLYCCWCAQDLAANAFWEAMGFTAIAFRTGSRTKGTRGGKRGPRIHIFWQKRIREGDATTPWWYPSTTGGGEMREDRLVFPIPPGATWRDVLPVVLADESSVVGGQLSVATKKKPRVKTVKKIVPGPKIKGGLWFAHDAVEREVTIEVVAKPKPAMDPRLKKLARELRDRWSERADEIIALPAKHDVRRMIAASVGSAVGVQGSQPPALPLADAA